MRTVQQARREGLLSDEQARSLTESAVRGMIGGSTQAPAQPLTTGELERLTGVAGAHRASVAMSKPGGESILVDARPTTAELRQPLQERAGFFGPSTVISDGDLRDAIRRTAEAELQNWRNGRGNVLYEDNDQQFGHLVRYWLACFSDIRPPTLVEIQRRAIGGGINYGQLLNPGASGAIVTAEIARVRADLLASVPGAGTPTNLNTRVEEALNKARRSRQDIAAWSAVFLISCVRETAIQLGLEALSGGVHVGREWAALGPRRTPHLR